MDVAARGRRESSFPGPEHRRFRSREAIAADAAPGSLVEAAVDDISVDVVRPPVVGIRPQTGVVTSGIVSVAPNPFRQETAVVYRTQSRAPMQLDLFDVAGRRVRTLVQGPMPAGEHRVILDREDGRPLTSGVYFLRLRASEVPRPRFRNAKGSFWNSGWRTFAVRR